MMIFGKRLSEYVAFCKWFLILIPAAGIIRLALSLAGAPNSTAKWISMTALIWIAVVYCSIRVHTTGFGSFRHLLVLCVLLNLSDQVVAMSGILIAILTGADNIFSVPEYAFGQDPRFHLLMHVLVGIPAGSIVAWLVGSVILAVTRKVSGIPGQASGSLAK
jgi:hypothetical protein